MNAKKIIFSEWFLFGAVFAVMLVRFWGIFESSNIPGWDTDAHFLALERMAEDFLPNGKIQGYMPEWFGGIPLFQFYAPLYFIAVAGAWLVSGKIIPLVLLFRISLFLTLALISVSVWFFTKTAFGKDAGKWSIILSLFAVFYPISEGLNGIGAGGVLFAGLITGSIGFSLLLIQFALLLKMEKNPGRKSLFVSHAALTAVIALTHTLSFIGSLIGIVFFLLYFHKNRRFFLMCLLGALVGAGIAAFWMLPFFAHLELTSSAPILMYGDPFVTTFPFNPSLLFGLSTLPYFNFWALGLFFATLYGMHLLIFKKNEKVVPFLFLFFFIFVVRNLIHTLLPGMTVHFYRFSPILFFLALAISSFAIDAVRRRFFGDGIRKFVFVSAILALVIHGQTTFISQANSLDPLNTDPYYSKTPLQWNFDEFPYAKEGKEFVALMAEKSDAERILVLSPPDMLAGFLGSPHYFDSMLVSENDQHVISGLYAESSPLTPFIMPVVRVLSEGKTLSWGENQLSFVSDFTERPYKEHLERMFDLGVNYVVSSDISIMSELLGSGLVTFEGGTNHFGLFKAKQFSPLAFSPEILPFLYVQGEGGVPFGDIAKAAYTGEKNYAIPIVNAGAAGFDEISEILSKTPHSGVIFSGKTVTEDTLLALKELPAPVILVSEDVEEETMLLNPSVTFIPVFESIEGNFSHTNRYPLYGWRMFNGGLSSLSKKNESKEPELVSFGAETITVRSDGFSVLNIGYSPYWKIENCETCGLFEVSPSRMAVYGNGIVTLSYDTSRPENSFGGYVSLLSLIALAGIGFFLKK